MNNLLCWNGRGLDNPRVVLRLRGWSMSSSLSLIFISETMISATVSENLKSHLGFDCAFGVDSVGRSSGLCVYWMANNLSFNLIYFSSHHICGRCGWG